MAVLYDREEFIVKVVIKNKILDATIKGPCTQSKIERMIERIDLDFYIKSITPIIFEPPCVSGTFAKEFLLVVEPKPQKA